VHNDAIIEGKAESSNSVGRVDEGIYLGLEQFGIKELTMEDIVDQVGNLLLPFSFVTLSKSIPGNFRRFGVKD
jgi:hypothetical protein